MPSVTIVPPELYLPIIPIISFPSFCTLSIKSLIRALSPADASNHFLASKMVSRSISISRGSSEHGHISVPPSLYSSHSRSHLNCNYKGTRNSKNTSLQSSSLEHLLRPARLENKHLKVGRAYKRRTMASNGSEGTSLEAKKSYGIGGAGNIRMPSLFSVPVWCLC